MNNNKIIKKNFIKSFFLIFFCALLIQGCGKKETLSTGDKKTEDKNEVKDIISLDKPVYVEFEMSGDMKGTMKAYYKSKKVRSESDIKIADKEVKSTMYSDGSTVYTISEIAGVKTGMKMDISKFNDPENKKNNMFDISSFKERMKDYTKIGEEEILGRHCDIYQSNKNPDIKLSVYQELIPLKIKTEKMMMVATKIDKDVNVGDDIFTPPSDVKYNDMGTMMEGLKDPSKMKDMKEQLQQLEEGMKKYKK